MRTSITLALAAVSLAVAAPAVAGFKLMPAGKPVMVAKSGLTITPANDWNKLGARPGRNAESWTLDGLTLNDLTFYGGIPDDKPLFREVSKKLAPLPRFSKTMLAPDIAQLFESSYRVANQTSLMSIDAIEPASFAGTQGFRFRYTYTRQGEEVRRLGEATGAVVSGKLYMVTFEAPAIHYFDRDIEHSRRVAASAFVGAVKKK